MATKKIEKIEKKVEKKKVYKGVVKNMIPNYKGRKYRAGDFIETDEKISNVDYS